MSSGYAGPKQLRRLLDAVMSLGSDLELDVVLRRLTETAVDLVDARYGALGVLDPTRTHLSDFITVGIDPEASAEIGDLPKGHGILGLLIADPRPLRLPDLNEHPDSFGFPPRHPPMTSFLGVPVVVGGTAYGNLYLTDKQSGEVFTDVDEELAVALAAAAGTAIEKARLHARVRELDVVEDRDRIARDLHDTVIQRLFATGLTLQGAARLAEPLPEVVERIQACVDELDAVVRQVRSSIFELHPPDVAATGLRRRLVELGGELADALGFSPAFHFDGPIDSAVGDDLAADAVAVVGEALANVARHASSPSAAVAVVVADGELVLTVDDAGDGPGDRRLGGRGLANMGTRAAARGGTCAVTARPKGGTRVRWSSPVS
ncbi:GAF domain-containing protein [Aquihabitans sp. G128]|uniref:GAF domain-containing sensor histidine kinase n=1 Tax=Aquihabitans sp. G128 TaxID=2849779 RepID=UPI001C22F085|nr:GAF domain-containing protein [Aquihabitans sp. G128]QXC61636.1 GAF domain-containing protein [Aquihabitans sp. G128]